MENSRTKADSWKMNRLVKGLLAAGLLLAAVVLAGAWIKAKGADRPVSFQTASLKRGDLVVTISATGTIEPEELIDVGSQVAGKITAFGRDQAGLTVDYGSNVEENTILARIDDSLYASDVAQAKAQLEQARAGVLKAEADLEQMQAKRDQAERNWDRIKRPGPSRSLSEIDCDAYRSAFEIAKANVSGAKAAVAQARSRVAQVEAALARAQQNFDYCTIKSPVKGVIIDRRVNIGQTVVASLSAPSLFLIARDLRRMQVWVSVNEADIGGIHPGQPVTFTVDAFPGRVFQGQVGKVRLNATMTQNVVTYTVEVVTDNSDGSLLPYLTANVKFLVNERRDVLMAPNAALRYTPRPDLIAAALKREGGDAGPKPSVPASAPSGGAAHGHQPVVWIAQGGLARPVRVETGLTDGTMTEIRGGELKDGAAVVVGDETEDADGSGSGVSPFAPRLFSGSRGGGHGH